MENFVCKLDDGAHLDCKMIGAVSHEQPTLVFLHEGLGCIGLWKDFPERLSREAGLPALCYSRAGYGASSNVQLPRLGTYMHHEALAVLPELLKKLDISDAILFGHSDGASISLIYGGSGRANRVRGMIVESPHVVIEDITVESIRKAAHEYEHGDLRSRLLRHQGANVDCAFYGFAETWLNPENAASWNIVDYVKDISVPFLVIQGEDDEYGTLRQVELIHDAAPEFAEITVIPRCGHHPHFEVPDLVVDRSVSFVRKIVDR